MKKRILIALCMCLHKYTCIPQPWGEWEEDLNQVSDAFLPAVGLAIGLLWWGLAALAGCLLPGFLGAVLVALFPFAITGCAHLPGLIRSGENLLSRISGTGKRALRGGEGARILAAALALLQVAACADARRIFPLALIPVLSRCCMALGLLKGWSAGEEGEGAPRTLLCIEWCIAAGALLLILVFSGIAGLISGAAVLGVSLLCARIPALPSEDRNDLALVLAELCGLIVLAAM